MIVFKTPFNLTGALSIHIPCKRCGNCCYSTRILVTDLEKETISDYLERDIGVEENHINPPCLFYDNGCTVHPVKPMVCRLFPLGQRLVGIESRLVLHNMDYCQASKELEKELCRK